MSGKISQTKRTTKLTRASFIQQDRSHLVAKLPIIIGYLTWLFRTTAENFEFALSPENNYNWSKKWEEGLSPIPMDQNLTLAPTWWHESESPKAGIVLRLDPGLGFENDYYIITFLCLKTLTDLAPEATRVLDNDSRSGILTLAATTLTPAAAITRVDNNLSSLAVAKDNATQNNLTNRVNFSDLPMSSLTKTSNLIITNLTLNPLLELNTKLERLSTAKASLIIPGLLTDQTNITKTAYINLWLQVERQKNLEE